MPSLRLPLVLADVSQPHGEMDAVVPQLAQFDYLPMRSSVLHRHAAPVTIEAEL